jgi:hypothetical protein
MDLVHLFFEIEEDDINIFGVGMSMEKSLLAFFIKNLSLFWKYIMSFYPSV